MNEQRHPRLRIIGRALEDKGQHISDYLSQMLKGVNMEDPIAVLRASQDIATSYQAIMFQFRKLAGQNFDQGITHQFRSDIERLSKVGLLSGFARDLISGYAEFEPVERAAVKYFRDAEHHGQRSERYVMPILHLSNWKYGLGCLRASLQKQATKISSVGVQNDFRLVVSDEFKSEFSSRRSTTEIRPIEEPYALSGVNGGRDTDEYTVAEALKYIRLHHRMPLLFTEAVLFYSAHPRFLLEQEGVILLGEEYELPHGVIKYAFLSSTHSDRALQVGLISKEEADKCFVANAQESSSYGKKYPRYGKPSAAALIVS